MTVLKIKTSDKNTYKNFLTDEEIEVSDIYGYEDKVNLDVPVLLSFGGNGKTEWIKGFAGVCVVNSQPYDEGYKKTEHGENYFRLKLKIILRFKDIIEKSDLILYPETFDTGVGPSTRGERNQALGVIEEEDNKSLKAICRAIIDFEPDLENQLKLLFGENLINSAKTDVKVLVDPTTKKDYSKEIEEKSKKFKLYLQNIAKKENGEPLGEKTVSNYVSGMNQKDFNNFAKTFSGVDSIYLITNVEIANQIYENIMRDPLNESSNRTYSSCILKYKDFLIYEKNINISNTPLILYGPPGTGKTHEMQEKYISCFAKEDCFVTTFHQAFSYEEFVEGLKPFVPENSKDVNYHIEPGIFYNACERAAILAGYKSLEECLSDTIDSRKANMANAISEKKIVLLCIDEINRANVSSVFGDLISLVEDSKRLGAKYEMTAKLPYSKKDFGVPANLMIIGTMNTADRSIQLLDSALRRRFKFEELLPNYKALDENNSTDTAKNILTSINNRIRALLDKDHQIGHSYFIGKNTNAEILEVMRENIIPLLEEYFYNETDKIRRVLNETDDLKDETSHSEDYFYVLDMDAKNAVADTDDFNEERIFYKLNDNISDASKADNFIKHLVK